MATNPELDTVSGRTTTGHEWDGIKELNTPLPKWWVWVFIITIVWSIGYWVVMPAWPTMNGYTQGMLDWSSRAKLANTLDEVEAGRASWMERLQEASVTEIAEDRELLNYAMAGGKFLFAENCAPCHGSGGAGGPGYPTLVDDEWIWGGSLDDIHTTIMYGVRNDNPNTRFNEMPAYGRDGLLTQAEINDVAEYVLSLSGSATDQAAAERGAETFNTQCIACHGDGGAGMAMLGGPPLNNAIWLYEGGKEGIVKQLNNPRHGVMPAWVERLDETAIKQLAVYVHSLGGGQ